LWSLGSYGDSANYFLPMSSHLVIVADVGQHDSVLDVACGTGIITITAVRKTSNIIIGLDITPELLIRAKQEADKNYEKVI
jgi:ubiquinone/menaquinone biosynthesis C-methylase UbiE